MRLSAALSEIKKTRADLARAEATVAELDRTLRKVRDDMQPHRCGWKWLDDYIDARATGKES